jgi:hypothetical protein
MKETEFNNLVEKLLNEALDEKIAEIKSKLEVTEKKDEKWIQDIDMKEGSFKKYCGGEVTCECVEKALKAGGKPAKKAQLYLNMNSDKCKSLQKENDADRLLNQIMEVIKEELGEEDMKEGNAFMDARCKAGCKGGNGSEIEGFDGKKVTGWSDEDKEACGCKSVKESRTRKLKLTENELIDLIEKIVVEEKAKGLQVYDKVHNEDGKENKEALNAVAKKMKDYTKEGSNGNFETNPVTFPKGNSQLKKGEKIKKYTPSDAVDEYIEAFAYPGQTNLTFDEIKPNDELIQKYLEGDSTTGNAQVDEDGKALGNVTPDEVGKKFKKNYDENLYGIEQAEGSYKRVTQPVDEAGDSTTKGKMKKKSDKILNTLESVEEKKKMKLNEELNKIQKITNYNQKTQ